MKKIAATAENADEFEAAEKRDGNGVLEFCTPPGYDSGDRSTCCRLPAP